MEGGRGKEEGGKGEGMRVRAGSIGKCERGKRVKEAKYGSEEEFVCASVRV